MYFAMCIFMVYLDYFLIDSLKSIPGTMDSCGSIEYDGIVNK